jgi:arsenate reductase
MNEKPCALFVCTHNAARSQMAEALLRDIAGGRYRACSAGFAPTEMHPLTRQVLAERGSDADSLRAKSVRDFLGKVAVRQAIIVCAAEEESCPRLFPFAPNTLNWVFEDPAQPEGGPELQLARFRRVRDQIKARLQAWLRES